MSSFMVGMDLLKYDRDKTCCFTGHRSSKLPGEGDRDFPGMKRLESNIEMELKSLVTDKGVRYFITGMASGIDLICAECVLRLKAAVNDDIELICVVPYVGQIAEMKTLRERYLYTMIENKSTVAVTLADGYYKDCYKARNMFMVDNSSFLLAVYKPSLKGSGTLQTINYAKKCGLNIKMIDLDKNPQFYS